MTLLGRIAHLEKEHAEIDKKIDGMESTGKFNDEHLHKLKQQRLHIKDNIVKLKSELEFREQKANG
jgi:hypothetical protein